MPDGSLVRISASSQHRASPTRRLRAFLFTDRIGQTLASVLGLGKLLRWFVSSRLSKSSSWLRKPAAAGRDQAPPANGA
jgi:hypothetical protein